MLSRITPSGYTRIVSDGDGKGRGIFPRRAGRERVTLTWRNSLRSRGHGRFLRPERRLCDQVTFSRRTVRRLRASPQGTSTTSTTREGHFDARGLSRPYQRIVYRIGEIGDPKLQCGTVTGPSTGGGLRRAGGPDGDRPALYEILWFRVTVEEERALRVTA